MSSIAIAIATYNGAGMLEGCLDAIAAQTAAPDEVIVVDGGSTDGTTDILARRSDVVSLWRSEPDRGIYDAWNKAVSHVKADWVWFFGCDDHLAGPEAIATLKRELGALDPSVRLAYVRVGIAMADGRIVETMGEPWPSLKPKLRHNMLIPPNGFLARRELFDEVGAFDLSFRIAGDYDWFLRAMTRSEAAYIDHTLLLSGADGISAAMQTRLKALAEIARVYEKHGLKRSAFWHRQYAKTRLRLALGRLGGSRLEAGLGDLYRLATGRRARHIKANRR